jgi:hypothetical protein
VTLLTAALAGLALSGCQHCGDSNRVCNGRGRPTGADRASLNARSIRARLGALERWIGPTAGGVAFNMYGEIWASTARNTDYGIGPNGSRLTVDYAANRNPEEDPNWGPLGRASVRLKAIPAAVLPRIIAFIHLHWPHEIFQGARISLADSFHGGGLIWEFDTISDGAHDGVNVGEFYARANGSDFCLLFSKQYPCSDGIDAAAG